MTAAVGALAALLLGGRGGAPAFACDPPPSHVVLLVAGQSNASGRGELDAHTEPPDARVLMLANDYVVKTAYEPVDDPTGQVDLVSSDAGNITATIGHGFALRAAKDLLGAGDGAVAQATLVPCAKGSTSIYAWQRGDDPADRATLFGSMIHRARTASAEPPLAVLWHQGEANVATDPALFAQYHAQFVADVREQLGAGVLFVTCQLGLDLEPGAHPGHAVVAETHRRMESGSGWPEEIAGHFLVVTFDLPLRDDVHLGQQGQRELGRRIALALRERALGEAVDGTGPRLVRAQPVVSNAENRRRILARFDRPISATANAYDSQFRVAVDGAEAAIASVERAPEDDRVVAILLADNPRGAVTVQYGRADGLVPGTTLTHVVRGATGLPAPRFGPLPVEEVATGDGLLFR